MSQPNEWDSWDEPARELDTEYKTLSADSLVNHEQLNRLAMEGWELSQIITPHGEYNNYTVYLIRKQ